MAVVDNFGQVQKFLRGASSRGSTFSILGWGVLGLVVGVTAMYMLDPSRGTRRRAIFRDKLYRYSREAREFSMKKARNFSNHLRGMYSISTRTFHPSRKASDEKLVQRVRSAFGKSLSHPRAVHVEARDGIVTLHGPILHHEVKELISCVAHVPGVKQVITDLEVHRLAGNVSSLQGEGKSYLQRH